MEVEKFQKTDLTFLANSFFEIVRNVDEQIIIALIEQQNFI